MKKHKSLKEIVGEGFLEDAEKYIEINKDKISVDWKKFSELIVSKGTYNSDLSDDIKDILIKLNVFSKSLKGNYVLMGAGVCLNPTLFMSHLFFTKKEDAVTYKNAKYSGAIYDINIFKGK